MIKKKYTPPYTEAIKIYTQTILAGSDLNRGNPDSSGNSPEPDSDNTFWTE